MRKPIVVMSKAAVLRGDRCKHKSRSQRFCRTDQAAVAGTGLFVGQHDVDAQVWGMFGEHVKVCRRGEPLGFTGLRGQVERDDPTSGGLDKGRAQIR